MAKHTEAMRALLFTLALAVPATGISVERHRGLLHDLMSPSESVAQAVGTFHTKLRATEDPAHAEEAEHNNEEGAHGKHTEGGEEGKGHHSEEDHVEGGHETAEEEGHESEHGEHGEHGEHHKEGAGKPMALLMIGSMVFGTIVFSLTQTKLPHVANTTILVLDNVIAIFLAVLWFQALTDILEEVIPHGTWAFMFVHTVVVLFIAIFIAWKLRSSTAGIATFCGCGAHFCAFTGRHFALETQEEHFTTTVSICAIGGISILLFTALVWTMLYACKRKVFGFDPCVESEDESVNTFLDRFDDVENDFAAMALASYWTMVVRFSIVKKYPEEEEIEPGSDPEHTPQQRTWMLGYCLLVACVGGITVHFLQTLRNRGYLARRIIDTFSAFICMAWVFAFLLWGEMHFYERSAWNERPMLARIVFAGICSGIALLCIVVLAPVRHRGGAALMLLRSAGLLAGIAWEEAFDVGLEVVFEGKEHGHWLKGLTACVIAAIVLPAYISYFKPYTLSSEKAEAASGD